MKQGETDSIREAFEEFMPERVIVRRKGYVGGESGGDDYTPVVIAQDVPARKKPGFGVFRLVADQFQGIVPFTFTLRFDQDIETGDQIIDEWSVVYEVRHVRSASSYNFQVKVLADRVT